MRDTSLIVMYKKHPVRININSDYVITHIGYALFQDTLSLYPSYIENFIERYMLELALPNANGISVRQKMNDDGVNFVVGSYEDILNLSVEDTLQIVSLNEYEKGYMFTLLHSKDTTASFCFPKDVQLIRGKDKIELDNHLFSTTHWDTCKHFAHIDTTALREIRLAPYLIMNGDSYLSEQLTNTVFIQKRKGTYTLLNIPYVYPKQTLQNIMLYGSNYNISLRIEHHRYGYNTCVDTIPLNVWINLAYQDGCIPYWGIEKYGIDSISGSYIWVNESLGYIHVLFVEFPTLVLFGKDDVVKCSLHSYIRMSNVTDLFYDTKHTLY